MLRSLVGSEMCIRDSILGWVPLPMCCGEVDSARWLSVFETLERCGAAIAEPDLLTASRRVGLTAPPLISNNCTLNRASDWAAQNGLLAVLEFLVERGSTVHIPWADSCGEGRTEVLRFLLASGGMPSPAEAHIIGSEAHARVSEGFSFAYMNRQQQTVRFLVEEAGYDRALFTDAGERHEEM
eukprot:TRINITY_DN24972_c0_g2_i1.p1 TRINITY_DN24972_c0_g2~~TRINITY_DN24972_c0_g2_i1.p1  ORF type:complete len:207 (-),score=47.94 TRINITY_DN24972_c0_g2_i1:131-679(-)